MVNLFALRHINKFTQMLKAEGIDANKTFVKSYICLYFAMAICNSFELAIHITADHSRVC